MVKKKMAVSRKTANVLRKVIAYWRANKHRLDMDDWGMCHLDKRVGDFIEGDASRKVPPCRTTACLAGTVLLVTTEGRKFLKDAGYFADIQREKKGKNYRFSVSFPRGTEVKAADILQLETGEEQKLFYTGNWGEFGDEYEDAETAKDRFNAAVKRIEQFIKTRE